MAEAPSTDLTAKIAAVSNPLRFIALALLVIEGTLTAAVFRQFDKPLAFLVVIVASVMLLVLIVLGAEILYPGILYGVQPLTRQYSSRFAEELLQALDGPFRNLPTGDQQQAWIVLCQVLRESEGTRVDASYLGFCSAVAQRLETRLDFRARFDRGPLQGPVRQEPDAKSRPGAPAQTEEGQ